MNTLKEILGLPGVKESFGKTVREDSPLSISTDSRTIHSGQSFLALEGAKFKPMKFLEQLEQAPVVFYEKNPFNDKLARQARDKHFFVAVNDSVRFLQDIGSLAAKSFVSNGGKLIAIAGSNGKTTTKEMLFHLLKSFEPETVCTKKNNNNHIGVPLTLLQIESKTKFCVLELGSNHPEEIRFLCEISCPNIGVVTNIGDTHLEFFGSREEVFKEEGSLYEAIDNSSWASKLFFLNTDDQFLSQLPKKKHVIAYGKDDGNDIQVNASFDHALLRLEQGFEKTELCLLNDNITGEHNFINLSVAFIMARRLLKRTSKDLLAKAQSFVPTSNRSEWIELKGTKVFLDAYNANPSSMKAALKAFRQKVLEAQSDLKDAGLILGDMNELGPKAKTYHEELGRHCLELGFKNLIFVGSMAGDYNAGCGGLGAEFSSVESLKRKNSKAEDGSFLNYKWLFIKGSRSLQLESIVDIN